jgi:hypothetical protein
MQVNLTFVTKMFTKMKGKDTHKVRTFIIIIHKFSIKEHRLL